MDDNTNNNKLIIKTQFQSNELISNKNNNRNENFNITNNLNMHLNHLITNNKLKQASLSNEDYIYNSTRLRTSNEIELLEVEENDDDEAEEISKINVKLKPSISPASSCSLQLPSFDNLSSFSSISSNSSSLSNSSTKNKNLKSVVFVIDKQQQQHQLNQQLNENMDKTDMKTSIVSDNEEISSLADSSFSSASLSLSNSPKPLNPDEITHGKVKHLRNKFNENINSINNFKRRTSDTIKNYQLKKCHSVIFNLDTSINQSTTENMNKTTNENYKINLKTRAQSNNCIGDLLGELEDKMNTNKINTNTTHNNEHESLIDESSVFDNCGVKERIRKFNNDYNNNLKNDNNLKLKRTLHVPNDQFSTTNKYGGSCQSLNFNNITNTSKPIKHLITNVNISNNSINQINNTSNSNNNNKKINSMIDVDVSNDDSNSTFSDDLTNSDLSCTQDFKQPILKLNKSLNDNKENYFDIKYGNHFNSFEENYSKIKKAFNDLRKDNEEISYLLKMVSTKVKEASISFYDSYLIQNGLDEYSNTNSINSTLTTNNSSNELDTVADYDDTALISQDLFFNTTKTTTNNSNINNDNNIHLFVRHKF